MSAGISDTTAATQSCPTDSLMDDEKAGQESLFVRPSPAKQDAAQGTTSQSRRSIQPLDLPRLVGEPSLTEQELETMLLSAKFLNPWVEFRDRFLLKEGSWRLPSKSTKDFPLKSLTTLRITLTFHMTSLKMPR